MKLKKIRKNVETSKNLKIRNMPEFERLQSFVNKSDLDKSNRDLDIKPIFNLIAKRLEKSSRNWKIVLKLYCSDKEKQEFYFLEFKEGNCEPFNETLEKFDLEISIIRDVWWKIIKGEIPPMNAFLNGEMRIRAKKN